MIAAGGKVIGGAKAPFPTSDFSSFLLQAQASGAQVMALNNAGGDTTTSLKQAAEFGLDQDHAGVRPDLQRQRHQGRRAGGGAGRARRDPVLLGHANDATRAFSRRLQVRATSQGAMPNDMQAGDVFRHRST